MAIFWPTLTTVIALLASLTIALFAIVLLMAGSANSTPTQQTVIRWMMIATGVVNMACLGGAIALLVYGRPWTAAIIGGVPIAFVLVMFAVVMIAGADQA